jgi:hypothetical protein
MRNIGQCTEKGVKSKSDKVLSSAYIDKLDRIREDVCREWKRAKDLIFCTCLAT